MDTVGAMGYAEDAKVNLGAAREMLSGSTAELLQVAQVQATLAVLEAVDGLASQVAYLSDVLEAPRKD